MYPTVFFPICSISLYGENQIFKEATDTHVSFKARENFRYGDGIQPIRIFNAWNDMAARVKKMNLKRGSEVTIVAELRSYRDQDGNLKDSYNIISIDFVRTYQYRQSEKKEDSSVSEAFVQPEQLFSKETTTVTTKDSIHKMPSVDLDKKQSMISMDEYEKLYQ